MRTLNTLLYIYTRLGFNRRIGGARRSTLFGCVITLLYVGIQKG